MRDSARTTVFGAVVLIALGTTTLPAAADDDGVVCDGVLAGETVQGTLVVPEESTCIVDEVVVVGDVQVGLMSDLFAFDLTVTGDVFIDADAYVDLEESSVEGDIDGDVAFGASLVASNLDGDLRTRLALLALVLDSDVGGEVNLIGSARGNTDVLFDTARVDGDVYVDRPSIADVFNSTLDGTVQVWRSLDGSVVCTSELYGDTAFASGSGPLDIGAGNGCETNFFGGDLSVLNHRGTPVLEGNIVAGDLACEGNAAVQGANNRVRGVASGQCAVLEPALDSSTNSFRAAEADAIEERRNDVLELRESRRDTGEELNSAASDSDADEVIEERRDEIAELRGGPTPARAAAHVHVRSARN